MNRRGFLKFALAGAAAVAVSRSALAQYYDDYEEEPPVDVVDQNIYKHPKASSSNEPVGTQLVLAMDTSGSMENEEYEIQLLATAVALNSQVVRSAIKLGARGDSVAISLVDFDSIAQLRVPWIDIRGDQINDKPYDPGNPAESSKAPDKLDELVQEIIALPRRGSGGTSIDEALKLSYDLFLGCPWAPAPNGGSRVVDLFGDGEDYSWTMQQQRERLETIGVTINGFAIVNGQSGLDDFFREYLVTKRQVRSPDGVYSDFGRVWAVARDAPVTKDDKPGLKAYFNDVTKGMKQKISIEVAGLEGYTRALRRLGIKPEIPVPEVE